MYRAVSSEDVAAYLAVVQSLAGRYVNKSVMAEYDDLVQEGLIGVWESLRDGQPPSSEYIQLYMRQWVRKCWRLKRGDAVAGDSMYLRPETHESRTVHRTRG
jgi:DNA-directed RNA polymerase specialized sigma24 family protein